MAVIPVADSPPAARPASAGMASRTFTGLLVAQFFAAFNDQAIHAAAMFFAINTQTLTEENAITLMPILFYLPWGLFCTVSGYLADRYSKRQSLVAWKWVEVGITAVASAGVLPRPHRRAGGRVVAGAGVRVPDGHPLGVLRPRPSTA